MPTTTVSPAASPVAADDSLIALPTAAGAVAGTATDDTPVALPAVDGAIPTADISIVTPAATSVSVAAANSTEPPDAAVDTSIAPPVAAAGTAAAGTAAEKAWKGADELRDAVEDILGGTEDIWEDIWDLRIHWPILNHHTVLLIRLLDETEDQKVLPFGGEHWGRFWKISRVIVEQLKVFKDSEADIDEGTHELIDSVLEMLEVYN